MRKVSSLLLIDQYSFVVLLVQPMTSNIFVAHIVVEFSLFVESVQQENIFRVRKSEMLNKPVNRSVLVSVAVF